MLRSRTILVAFDVKPTVSDHQAQQTIVDTLEFTRLDPRALGTVVESWHIAEDNRIDDSDSDSAVFCATGKQVEARALLVAHGLG